MLEFLLEFPEFFQIPLAEWIDTIISWVLHNWAPFFDAIGYGVLQMLLKIERFLLWLPWIAIVLLVGVVAWRVMRQWWAGLLMATFLVLIGSFGYWDFAMMTLAIIIVAVIISLAIGIPTGILMARSNRVESIIRPVLDAMQTMPSFVYLIPA